MKPSIEVLVSPCELAGLAQRDLSQTVCLVFDVLRATSTMLTALANGAAAVIPVSEIPEALALRKQHPEYLLGGERDGLRIRADQSGGVDFDLGNSPREYSSDRVGGKTIVMTTTNGTRALMACRQARAVLPVSWLNLRSVSRWIAAHDPPALLLVCAGTRDQVAFEDLLAAGALCRHLPGRILEGERADTAHAAALLFEALEGDLEGAMRYSTNARRLLEHPAFRDDVAFCLERDTLDLVAALEVSDSGVFRIRTI